MFTVRGIYDGNTVLVDQRFIPVKERYEVAVTFLKPVKQTAVSEAEETAEKQTGYQRLLKYKKTLHRHIDYKKELAEARDE
jgi:hypothetical protein